MNDTNELRETLRSLQRAVESETVSTLLERLADLEGDALANEVGELAAVGAALRERVNGRSRAMEYAGETDLETPGATATSVPTETKGGF